MKKVVALCAAMVLGVILLGCGGNSKAPETAPTEFANGEYGVLQPLVDAYGFPFEFRHTEGMELTSFEIREGSAKREWHTNDDFAAYDNLNWKLAGNTLEITGAWTESFLLDMERGAAASLIDDTEYRMVVHLPDSIETRWYVPWDTDVGFTETDGVRYSSAEASCAVYLCQFVKDCLAEPDSFQIHSVAHMEKDGHHYYYLDFSQEVKNEEMERTYYFAEFDGTTLLCIVNEQSAIYYETAGDYTTKYPELSALFQAESAELLAVADIVSALK